MEKVNGKKVNQQRNSYDALREYYERTKIPSQFLEGLGLRQKKHQGERVLEIPYMDTIGNEIFCRYRLENGYFKSGKGARVPYGLWRLKGLEESDDFLILVEREVDAQTLWYKGFPALAVQDYSNWRGKEEYQYLNLRSKLYLVCRLKTQSGLVLKQFAMDRLRDKIQVVNIGGYKYVNKLYKSAPESFRKRFKKMLKRAIPLEELISIDVKRQERKMLERCGSIAKAENILDLLVEETQKAGIVGETKIIKAIYLALTSRLLNRPVSVITKGPSSIGKSWLPLRIVEFFPASAYFELTSASNLALAFSNENFQHRFLIFHEAQGINRPELDYLIRALLSEGRIRYLKATPTGGSQLLEKEGPTGLIMSTTLENLNYENETRHINLFPDISKSQTRKIVKKCGDEFKPIKRNERPDYEMWHEFQLWLERAEKRVKIPFVDTLAELVGVDAVRMRRDYGKLLYLIATHAMIYQVNRKRSKEGWVVANLRDYSAIYYLVEDVFSDAVKSSVPKEILEVINAIRGIEENRGKDVMKCGVSETEIAGALDVNKSTISRRVGIGERGGFLKRIEKRKGRSAGITLGEYAIIQDRVLPKPAVLKEQYLAWKEKRNKR